MSWDRVSGATCSGGEEVAGPEYHHVSSVATGSRENIIVVAPALDRVVARARRLGRAVGALVAARVDVRLRRRRGEVLPAARRAPAAQRQHHDDRRRHEPAGLLEGRDSQLLLARRRVPARLGQRDAPAAFRARRVAVRVPDAALARHVGRHHGARRVQQLRRLRLQAAERQLPRRLHPNGPARRRRAPAQHVGARGIAWELALDTPGARGPTVKTTFKLPISHRDAGEQNGTASCRGTPFSERAPYPFETFGGGSATRCWRPRRRRGRATPAGDNSKL